MNINNFTWATGIEDTFIPQARPGLRALDEYALTQHYQHWQADLDRVIESGVRTLRWGIPWYRVQPTPDRWDWRWCDRVLEDMVAVKGITPIVDLMHYGTPLWLDNGFLNTSYPQWVAEYAATVADRYQSLLHYYTPLNEPSVTADFCGRRAEWPPYLSGEDGYVKVLLAVARGIISIVKALLSVQPEMKTVQVEALWHYWTRDPRLESRVEQANLQQYLCFDLVTGRVDEQHPMYDYLCLHGFTSADLFWFQDQAVTFDFFGANFYPWSYGEVRETRSGALQRLAHLTSGTAIADVILPTYQRYQLPVMVTETSARADRMGRARWMDETITSVCQLRQQGIPVVGYTWFPLFTMIDWAYRRGRRPLANYLLHLGLYDSEFDQNNVLQRHPTELVERFRQHTGAPLPTIAEMH
jgi:beta-glucosidase